MNKINERDEKIKKLKEKNTKTEMKNNHWKRFNSDRNISDVDLIQTEDNKIDNNELDDDDVFLIDEIKNINDNEDELETEEVDEEDEDNLTKVMSHLLVDMDLFIF